MNEASLSQTQRRQLQASEPTVSAWVSANAGSGKTYVLTQRVIRLLLSGAEPAAILCLTFTKAAAAQMSRRIFDRLSKWTQLSDDELTTELIELTGRSPGAEERAIARRLFAKALETPGGLKIQTIHAFCERLLHQFPLEADVPSHFTVLDDNQSRLMIEKARTSVLMQAKTRDSNLGQAVWSLAQLASDHELERVLAEAVGKRTALKIWFEQCAMGDEPEVQIETATRDLKTRFGLSPSDNLPAIRSEVCDSFWTLDHCRDLSLTLADSPNGYDQRAFGGLSEILGASADGSPDSEMMARFSFFLTTAHTVRTAKTRFGAATRKNNPDLDQEFETETARLHGLIDRALRLRAIDATRHLLVLVSAVLEAYDTEKSARSCLDFDDLIAKTRALLMRSDSAAWVLFKLDSGLHHVLIDEAQDTSPEQWDVIQALTADFFAGDSAVNGNRTVFAVGDDKQSIFGFQGAEPKLLSRLGDQFQQLASAAGQRFVGVPLSVSFRSAAAVLDAVDLVFDGDLAARITDQTYESHTAVRRQAPGLVRVWPRVVRRPPEESEDWTTPVDVQRTAEVEIADAIAREIRELITTGGSVPSGNPVSPGEILILSARRGNFSLVMDRALKAYGLPTAGSDRIDASGHAAVLDLLAVADFTLLPQDDLVLAAVLKSPLFGLDDDDLITLAPRRGSSSLWQMLQASENASHIVAADRLKICMDLSNTTSPFEFFSKIVSVFGARAAFRASLGQQVDDVLDAFLSQVLVLEQRSGRSLQEIVEQLRNYGGDVKRESEEGSSAIRVMTVHGSKGLEADIVFLVDTGGQILPHQHRDQLVELADDEIRNSSAFFWRRSKENAPDLQNEIDAAETEKNYDEYYRLLYVAMTRARDLLYVTGIRPQRDQAGSWYQMIREALIPDSVETDETTGELLEPFEWPHRHQKSDTGPGPTSVRPVEVDLPNWAKAEPISSWKKSEIVRPSQFELEPTDLLRSRPSPSVDLLDAKDRGKIIHGLLDRMPEIPSEERAEAARHYVKACIPGDSMELGRIDALVDEALSVIDDKRLAPLFLDDARSEVPILGMIRRNGLQRDVHGRVDRLLVQSSQVWIADFKTGRTVPQSADAVPSAYLRQLALYSEVLAQIFPALGIRATLIWTASGAIMDFDGDFLQAHIDVLAEQDGVA